MIKAMNLLILLLLAALASGTDQAPAPPTPPVPTPAPQPSAPTPAPQPPVLVPPPVKPKVITQEGIHIYPTEGYLEVDGFICLDRGLIEVYASSPGGKVHEALLVIKPKPQLIHFGLIILGMKEGKGCEVQGDPKNLPRGEPVDLFVEWEEGGKTCRVRAEDLVYNVHTQRQMERGVWVFTGSRFVKGQDPNTGQEVDIYLSNATGTVITTFRDPASIVDNASEFSGDDSTYVVNDAMTPPRGTPIKLLIMPKGKGPKERRQLSVPNLSDADIQKVPGLIDAAVGTDAAAAEALKALAAMGRPILSVVRTRIQNAAEDKQAPLQKLFGDLRQAIFAPTPPPPTPAPPTPAPPAPQPKTP